jgi:imidazolonepropionase-like amidohydrolase
MLLRPSLASILQDGDRIERVADSSDIPRSVDYKTIDLGGRTLMPGSIDLASKDGVVWRANLGGEEGK